MTDRVAGFVCKAVFTHHKQCVSGLAVVPKNEHLEYILIMKTATSL